MVRWNQRSAWVVEPTKYNVVQSQLVVFWNQRICRAYKTCYLFSGYQFQHLNAPIDRRRCHVISLGPYLTNIFAGFFESKLFCTSDKLPMYYRYVDDTFVIFHDEKQCDLFLSKLNSLYPALWFTHKKECNHALSFLDVLVEKTNSKFLTTVYRKPTFTCQYLRSNSLIDLID